MGSPVLVQRAWRSKYHCSKAPSHTTILRIAKQFEKTGSVIKLHSKKRSLPKVTILRLICSDEAYFYLTETVNKQNNRLWLQTRPTNGVERPLYDPKVLVWCAMSSERIYGPYFFDSTVTEERYISMLKFFFGRK